LYFCFCISNIKFFFSFQEAILDAVSLEKNIARNLALKENVFMMVICVELRIPLFLVGKPGSSKSLARLTVAGAMQGNASSNDIFKEFKQVSETIYACYQHKQNCIFINL
jgi:hypothetical protein